MKDDSTEHSVGEATEAQALRPVFARMEDGLYAKFEAEEALEAILGVELLGIGFDDYDASFEIYPLDALDLDMTDEVHSAILALGCRRYWINFRDGTERYCQGTKKASDKWECFNKGTGWRRNSAAAIRKAALEEAAQVALRQVAPLRADSHLPHIASDATAHNIARAIRALSDQAPS